MSRQPGFIIAAAVLGYVQAAIFIIVGLQTISAGSVLDAVIGGAGFFIFVGLVYLGVGALFIVGGVQLQRGNSRGPLVAASMIAFVLFLLLLITAHGSFFIALLVLHAVCPAIALFLASRPTATEWLSGGSYARPPAPSGYGGPPGYGPPLTYHAPAMGAGVLRDGNVVRAFESFGQRVMTGQPPWAAETQPLAAVRDAIGAARGSIEAVRLLDGLESIARTGTWPAIGVWQFVQQYGLAPWRKSSPLLGTFLGALRTVMSDPAAPPINYRLTVDESDAVRRTESRDSPLWRLVQPRPDDLEPQEPPAVGSEPPVADITGAEQRLIATVGSNQILATRSAGGGYVATLVRIGNQPGVAPTETYARAETLVGLLREVGSKLGPSAAEVEASPDLMPYLTFRRPSWWSSSGTQAST